MSIEVGTAPVSWGIMEVNAWSSQQAYTEVLDDMVAAGYVGTELGPLGYFPTDPEQIKAELSARGLSLVAAFAPLPIAIPDRHEEAMATTLKIANILTESGAKIIVLADEMNPQRMAVAGRVIEERDGMTGQQWEFATKFLSLVAARCRELGLITAFHHHAGTFVETPPEIEHLCACTEPDLIGLCLDTGHYYYGGGDPLEAVRKYDSRIRHLHLKDIRDDVLQLVRRAGYSFLEAIQRGIFCELGQGAIDLPAVIRELKKQGYCGWAIFEQDIDPSRTSVPPVVGATRSRQYLKRVAQI
jgi:inosose dehydratase